MRWYIESTMRVQLRYMFPCRVSVRLVAAWTAAEVGAHANVRHILLTILYVRLTGAVLVGSLVTCVWYVVTTVLTYGLGTASVEPNWHSGPQTLDPTRVPLMNVTFPIEQSNTARGRGTNLATIMELNELTAALSLMLGLTVILMLIIRRCGLAVGM